MNIQTLTQIEGTKTLNSSEQLLIIGGVNHPLPTDQTRFDKDDVVE